MTKTDNRAPGRRRFLSFSLSVPAALGLSAGRAVAQEAMIPTARDSEGPFFISSTPVVGDLNRFGKSGERMRIEGRVMSASVPEKPVANARIELWQTDGLGKYYPEANGDYRDYADSEIDMRGTVITDTDGRFSVMSLFPAEYWPRPSHIHYWIRADGFRPLVTQHYLDSAPGKRPHRTAWVDRSRVPAVFPAPVLYIEPI